MAETSRPRRRKRIPADEAHQDFSTQASSYWPTTERAWDSAGYRSNESGGAGTCDVLVLIRADVDEDAMRAYVEGYEVTGTEGERC